MVSRVRKAQRMQHDDDEPLDDIPFINDDGDVEFGPGSDPGSVFKNPDKIAALKAEMDRRRRESDIQKTAEATLQDKPVGFIVDRGGVQRCLVARGSVPEPGKNTDDEKRKLMYELLKPKQLNGFRDVDHVHEWAAFIHECAPWMAPVSEYLMNEQVRRVKNRFRFVGFDPVIIHGDPGIGKTHYARTVAENAAVPLLVMDGATMISGFQLAGVERGWGSAGASPIVRLIADTGVANPVIMIDEIDKIGGSDQKAGNPHNVLLGLLEKISAQTWRCPYTELAIDMSRVSWIMTANDVSRVPQPLLDRCKLIRCNKPSQDDVRSLVTASLMDADPQIVAAAIKATKGRSLRSVRRMIDAVNAAAQKPVLH